jgi:hypothetical protein
MTSMRPPSGVNLSAWLERGYPVEREAAKV